VPVVDSLASFDEGDGPALFAGGQFTTAGSVPALRVARWKDGQWSALAGGVTNPFVTAPHFPAKVAALAAADFGDGAALYAGGIFSFADGRPSANIARWERDPANPACAILGTAAESEVGRGAGGPHDVVLVNGSAGNGHRVNAAVGATLTIEVRQPPSSALPAAFILFGFLGTPTAADEMELPAGLGRMSFVPCPFAPADPRLFVLADAFGLPGCQALVGAQPASWSLSLPAGVPIAASFALQGIAYDPSAAIDFAKTNAVLVIVD
jgi:hypothetical protein